ncbi:MAG: DNA polymerase II [Candidatus Woesearchaeota archaeon]
MKGFIIYPTYRVIDNKAYVYLFGRLENNQSFLTINYSRPYFFIKTKDLKKAQKLDKFDSEKTDLKNLKKEPVTKIILDIPSDVPKLRYLFEESNIECYEADIRFSYRFMIDKKIQGSLEIEGDYESSETVDRIYKEPEISPTDYIPQNLQIVSLDIETSTDGKRLYCLSLYSEKYKKSFIISTKKFPNTISCPDEESLLETFQKALLLEDPDIITGWHVIDFDLNYLKEKFTKYKLPFNLGRDNLNSQIKIQESFFRESKADVSGRQVLDGINLLKTSFIKLRDYKLDTAAIKFLGQKKLIAPEDKSKIDEYYKKDQKLLLDYNLLDSKLVYDILLKSKVLDLTIQRSLLTGMPLDRVSASIASFDSIYLKKARKRKIVVPSGKFSYKPSPITGGFVMESKPGIYDNVLVLDFKSLYPSMMRTFNIDPISFLGKKKEKNAIKAPNNVYFRNGEGILPEIIKTLLEEREKATKAGNKLARQAIKILLLSFWGIVASPSFRFFNMDMANAITTFGQHIIKLTAKKVEELGYEVIYSDTDSVFVNPKTEDENEAEKVGQKIETHITSFYEEHIEKEYKRESCLELEFEKNYLRFLMPKIRGSEKGAKKRYAGLVKKDGKEEVEIVGLEAIRGDWTEAAQIFQKEILDRIFHKKEITSFVKKFINDVLSGDYDDRLVYRKSIRKELGGYTKTTPPHVKAARKLDKLESNVIEYFITTEGPEPKQKLKHELDYDHYIAKQIKPIAEMVLVFFNLNFEDLVKGSKQTKLFSF